MKHPKLLYGFIAVLGIAFLTVFFMIPIFFHPWTILFSSFWSYAASVIWIIVSFFLSIVGVVFLAAGVCGIGSQYFKNSQDPSTLQSNFTGKSVVKHYRLYGFIALLGIVFLGVFCILAYLGGHSAEVTRFFMSIYPFGGFLMFIVFLLGGTTLLTVGVCGTVRRYFDSNQNLLTMLVAIAVPSLILLPFVYLWIVALEVGL